MSRKCCPANCVSTFRHVLASNTFQSKKPVPFKSPKKTSPSKKYSLQVHTANNLHGTSPSLNQPCLVPVLQRLSLLTLCRPVGDCAGSAAGCGGVDLCDPGPSHHQAPRLSPALGWGGAALSFVGQPRDDRTVKGLSNPPSG